jgi:hypothetical protein
MTPFIIKSFTHPDEVPEIMHNLAGVTFVQSVQVNLKQKKREKKSYQLFFSPNLIILFYSRQL